MFADDTAHVWRRIRSKPANVAGAAAMLALGIALTTAIAAWQPARHAARVDPATLLRSE